jgi:ankyrin repeat protein
MTSQAIEDGLLLIKAVTEDNLEQVRHLLAKGADTNVRDSRGWAPLHHATSRKGCVQVLLSHEATDPNVITADVELVTPLHLACEKGKLADVELLLNHGADPNFTNDYCYRHWTPLHYACLSERPEVVKMLLEHGADLTVETRMGSTPLDVAIRERHHPRVNEIVAMLEQEAQRPAPPVQTNKWTALHAASKSGPDFIVALLLKRGASSAAVDKDGRTPLHIAIKSKNESIVKLLLAHGASALAKDRFGQDPLNDARRSGHPAIAKLLVEHFDW